jgi:predicted ATPase/DNA-binding SARP family transcriptional activator
MEATFRLRFLGTIQVEQNGEPVRGFRSRKALALLGYLATQGQPVPRERLADLFWEDKPETEGRANLSWALNKIGSRLPGCLQADRHTVQFQRTSSYWLDIDAFESLVAQKQVASLSAAVELYRGEFLEGLYLDGCGEFDIWLVGERERWHQRVAGALDELITYHNQRGEYEPSLRFARRLLALEPWREETHQQVMRLLARSGQRSAALAQYETCRRTLAEELSVKPMRETTALYERIHAVDSARRHNLPAQPTPFVGREKELDQVIGLLDQPDCRLLTLVGPGGIGKTRLALQAATARLDAFLEGVYFVPLAGISSAEFLVSAVADALQFFFFGSQDPRSQLVNYLRGKEMLLLLDNMEHLLPPACRGDRGGVELLVEILQQAPEVKLLVTSRERLNLRWERCFEIEGLAYPKSETTDNKELESYSAVQLFQQVAHRAHSHFSFSARARPAVAHICRLVEGMPLGIELAAAWVRTRTCEEIAQEIERDLGFLTTSLYDVPEQHRSLRATFERSWRLLTPSEQRVFTRLSVFHGGFQRDAAGEVADASPTILDSLVDKSLLRFVPSGRYEMHELLRQYAAEKLAALPEAQTEARDRHCAHYVAFLQRQEANLTRASMMATLAAIRSEIGNIHAAWHWAVTLAKLEEIERSLNGLALLYRFAGPFQEAEMLIRRAVDRVSTLVAGAERPKREAQIVLRGCFKSG